MRLTLTERLNRLPPVFCRILAKTADGALMTDSQLCARTGWGKTRLRSVYQSLSWSEVTVAEVDTFMSACGLGWSSTRRQLWLLNRAWAKGGVKGLLSMRHMKRDCCWRNNQMRLLLGRVERLLTYGPESGDSTATR